MRFSGGGHWRTSAQARRLMRDNTRVRAKYERLAIPYSFKPALNVGDAVLAAFAAFLRIFLGSLLFAFCGAYTLSVWSAPYSLFWRLTVALGMAALFLGSFASMLWAIGAAVQKLSRRDA